jgi:hypothetical protein
MPNILYSQILAALITRIAGSHAALTSRVYDDERFSEEPSEYIALLSELDKTAGGSGVPVGVVLNWAGWAASEESDFRAIVSERISGEILYPYTHNHAGDKTSWTQFREIVQAVRDTLFLKSNLNLGLGSAVRIGLMQADIADMVVTDFGEEGTGSTLVHYLPFIVPVVFDFNRC